MPPCTCIMNRGIVFLILVLCQRVRLENSALNPEIMKFRDTQVKKERELNKSLHHIQDELNKLRQERRIEFHKLKQIQTDIEHNANETRKNQAEANINGDPLIRISILLNPVRSNSSLRDNRPNDSEYKGLDDNQRNAEIFKLIDDLPSTRSPGTKSNNFNLNFPGFSISQFKKGPNESGLKSPYRKLPNESGFPKSLFSKVESGVFQSLFGNVPKSNRKPETNIMAERMNANSKNTKTVQFSDVMRNVFRNLHILDKIENDLSTLPPPEGNQQNTYEFKSKNEILEKDNLETLKKMFKPDEQWRKSGDSKVLDIVFTTKTDSKTTTPKPTETEPIFDKKEHVHEFLNRKAFERSKVEYSPVLLTNAKKEASMLVTHLYDLGRKFINKYNAATYVWSVGTPEIVQATPKYSKAVDAQKKKIPPNAKVYRKADDTNGISSTTEIARFGLPDLNWFPLKKSTAIDYASEIPDRRSNSDAVIVKENTVQ